MHSRVSWVATVATLLLTAPACIDANASKLKANEGGAGGTGAGARPPKGGSSAKGGTAGTDADGGDQGGVGGSGGVKEAPPKGDVPVLDSADGHVTGRGGDDVTLNVTGTDVDANVELVAVAFADAQGNAVSVFDTDGDGTPDSASNRVFFDRSVLGKKAFTGIITLHGFAAQFPTATAATLHLVDLGRQVSEDRAFDIGAQEERSVGESCDPALVESRCDTGLSCGSDPPACQAGTAPQITQIAYVFGPLGPRLLVLGTDPDDDIGTIRLGFFDHGGAPVEVDLNADQVPDSSSFDLTVFGASHGGTFFVGDQLGLDFNVTSPKIVATPVDGQGSEGAPKTVDYADASPKNTGQSCDPRGFDLCAGASVCSPGIDGEKNVCAVTATLQTRSCGGATVLDPSKDENATFGRAEGASLWDPPPGCGQVAAVKRPEGVVRLHLAEKAAHLTITTDVPETSFDTIVYLVPGCPSGADKAAPCNDDVNGSRSTLTADAVPAGDYLIVVDSADANGGGFGVRISVE